MEPPYYSAKIERWNPHASAPNARDRLFLQADTKHVLPVDTGKPKTFVLAELLKDVFLRYALSVLRNRLVNSALRGRAELPITKRGI